MSQDLRQACEQATAPDTPAPADEAGARAYFQAHHVVADDATVAAASAYARYVEFADRTFFTQLDLADNGVSARQCARYMELLRLVDAYNSEVRSAAQSWPR